MAGPNVEFYIEMVDYGLLSSASAALTFLRTARAFNAADYAGDSVTFTLEVVASNTNATTDYYLQLLDITNAANKLPDNSGSGLKLTKNAYNTSYYSASFSPAAGLNTYEIAIPQTAAANVYIRAARIRVAVTGATKGVVQVPLTCGGYGASSAVNNATLYVDRCNTTGYAQMSPAFWSQWLYAASEWADISGLVAEYVFASVDATNVNMALTTAGSTTVLNGSATANDAGTTVHPVRQSIAAGDLTDGTVYEARGKSAIAGSTHACAVSSACLYVKLSNAAGLTKVPVWLRVYPVLNAATIANVGYYTRARLYSANYGGAGYAVTYCTEAVSFDATSETGVGIIDGGTSDTFTTGSSRAGTTITAGSSKAVQRSSPWSAPTSGNRICGNKPTTTGSHTTSGLFVVIATVANASETASGGSSASVTASASGAGVALEVASGGSVATVTAGASGAGSASEVASGGSVAAVIASACGAGVAAESASGGSIAAVTSSAAGAGTAVEAASGGSIANVSAGAAGVGVAAEVASGGSIAEVTVAALGAGTSTESQDESGGSIAGVSASVSGAGTAAEAASGGSQSPVGVSAQGAGTAAESSSGGSAANVVATASGAGTSIETGQDEGGGSVADVGASATGSGVAADHTSGGSISFVTTIAYGEGQAAEAESGGSIALIIAIAGGAGHENIVACIGVVATGRSRGISSRGSPRGLASTAAGRGLESTRQGRGLTSPGHGRTPE